uniref:Uncharacterized protein n=1 Tax=Pseudo-nitzschia australis TaxID=44445 RepID=A0A6V0D8X2_9STRA
MAEGEDSIPETEPRPITGISSRTGSAHTVGRANPNLVATSNTFGETDDESSNHASFPSENTATMVAKQEEKSPFDSTLTFVLHKLVGIDFTKDQKQKVIAGLVDNSVDTWDDFINMTPKMVLDMEGITNIWKAKFLGLKAFAESHLDKNDELVTPDSVNYRRPLLQKFMKDFKSSDINKIGSYTSNKIENETTPPIDLVNTAQHIVDVDHNGNITMVAEQDEKSPFDSSLTFVYHKMFSVDFTKEPRNQFMDILVGKAVTTWDNFINMTSKMILGMKELDNMWIEKLLGCKAFIESIQDKDGEIATPNSIDYKRSFFESLCDARTSVH